MTTDSADELAQGIIDRSIARLQKLHDYAGRPSWDAVVADEIRRALPPAYERDAFNAGVRAAAAMCDKWFAADVDVPMEDGEACTHNTAVVIKQDILALLRFEAAPAPEPVAGAAQELVKQLHSCMLKGPYWLGRHIPDAIVLIEAQAAEIARLSVGAETAIENCSARNER